jgi:hypothetical protein
VRSSSFEAINKVLADTLLTQVVKFSASFQIVRSLLENVYFVHHPVLLNRRFSCPTVKNFALPLRIFSTRLDITALCHAGDETSGSLWDNESQSSSMVLSFWTGLIFLIS